VQRDVEALKKGEYWSQRLQKAEQESQNTPNKSYLQFENFDKLKYEANQAHNSRGSRYNPNKDPEPSDAEEAYKNAISGKNKRRFYSIGKGGIYRYSDANNGTVHFSGNFTLDEVRQDDANAAKKLQQLGKTLGRKIK